MKRTLIIFLTFATALCASNRKHANYNQLVEGDWRFEYPELKVTEKEKEIEFKETGEFKSAFFEGITHWAVGWDYDLYLFSRGKLFMRMEYDFENQCYVQTGYGRGDGKPSPIVGLDREHPPLIFRQKTKKTQQGGGINSVTAPPSIHDTP